MSGELREALHEAGEQMPPTRLTRDPWAVGRRQRRRGRLGTVAAALVAVLAGALAVPVILRGPAAAPPAAPANDARVPAQVGLPWMWQATVEQDPRGPATMLFSGGGIGLRGIDLIDHEGKIAVVGRDGSYRMLLYGGMESVAGEDVLLSPDGRYVADSFWYDDERYLTITDLTDGRRRGFAGVGGSTCCAKPVAWAPDGKGLLVLDYLEERLWDQTQPARLALLDLTTGATTKLLDGLGDRWALRTASVAAFSPDGSLIAATAGNQLNLLDRTGKVLWSRDLGSRRKLAGLGAFTPDGSRIAVADLEGCLERCDGAELGARVWRIAYLDATTGQDVPGPVLAPVRGQAVRALGWRHGTDLVALRYEPEAGPGMHYEPWNDTGFWETGHVQLLALRPGGEVETLLDPPWEVTGLDVPRDLLEAGRFGGSARAPEPFPARPVIVVVLLPFAVPAAGLLGGLVLWRWRRRRRRAPGTGHAVRLGRPDPPYPTGPAS